MKYVSIDLEGTGLDPETDQILEFGAVVDDTLRPEVSVDDLPTFRRVIKWDRIEGHPIALAMNAGLIEGIARQDPDLPFCSIAKLAVEFNAWLKSLGFRAEHGHQIGFVAAGKNFGTCDDHFLRMVPDWKKYCQPFRRVLDPAILYFDPLIDEAPPGLDACLSRAGIDSAVKHTAVDDAKDVVRVLRHKFSQMRDLHVYA